VNPSPPPIRLREAGAPAGVAEFAGILLHGRDRTKKEMLELAEHLDVGGVRWLAPWADSGRWYPGRFMEPISNNEPYLSRAVERCRRLVDNASEGGRLGPDRIFLVGFSQGACLALEYGLRFPESCAAVIAFTGALMGPSGTEWRPPAGKTLKGLRVFVSGSDADEWIPPESTRETALVLESLGADVALRVYHGRPHIVSDEETSEARAFLAASLPGVTAGRS
jgi:predicted esterase